MLPYSYNEEKKSNQPIQTRIKTGVFSWLRIIISDEKSRNLFFFLLLNTSFAFVELFYGIATNR